MWDLVSVCVRVSQWNSGTAGECTTSMSYCLVHCIFYRASRTPDLPIWLSGNTTLHPLLFPQDSLHISLSKCRYLFFASFLSFLSILFPPPYLWLFPVSFLLFHAELLLYASSHQGGINLLDQCVEWWASLIIIIHFLFASGPSSGSAAAICVCWWPPEPWYHTLNSYSQRNYCFIRSGIRCCSKPAGQTYK